MTPIDDFELLFEPPASRFCSNGEMPSGIAERPPPNRWLRMFDADDDLEEKCIRSFAFRGALVDHLRTYGDRIFAQFRANSGYVVFAGGDTPYWPDPWTPFGDVMVLIYYVLEDFSGADFGEFYYPSVPAMKMPDFKGARVAPEANPVAETVIVDDARLDFRLRELGWYRLTLFEDRPRPFAISNWRFNRENTPIWAPRYFNVRRHWPRTVAQKTELSERISV